MKNKNGFTLVELTAVIAVVAILLVLVIPPALNVIGGSKKIIKGYQEDILLDAAKYYVTDIDQGGLPLKYTGTTPITINDHVYEPNDVFSSYDAKVYLIENGGMDITVETLVNGGYYDKECKYAGTTIEYKDKGEVKTTVVSKDKNCNAPKDCKIHVGIVGRKVEGDRYYVSDNYTAELGDGCN